MKSLKLFDLKEINDAKLYKRVHALLCDNRDIFVHGNIELGTTNLEIHRISTVDASPIRRGPYRIPYSQYGAVETAVEEILEARAI
jgi:hypothetical protein